MPRKEKKFHFIYKTTNLVTGKYYIGMHSTDDLEDGYMGSGKRLRYSIRKYGRENHERLILEFFDTRQELASREREVVDLDLIAKEECINLKVGGEGGGGIRSKDHHNKMIEGSIKWIKNKWLDEEYRKKITQLALERLIQSHKAGKIKYDTFTGKKHSEEAKLKMSESRKGTGVGQNNSQFGTMWITNGVENRKIKKDNEIPEDWYKGRI